MKDFVKAVVLLVVGAAIGYSVEGYKSRAQGRIRFLDWEVRLSKSVLSLPALPGQKLDVLLNGAKVDHITKVTVTLNNWEDKDFTDVPVYIILEPKRGEQLKIIAKDAYIGGEEETRDGISELQNVKPPLKTGARKFGFTIHTANRSNFSEGFAEMLFYLEGVVEPETDISIDKAGLRLRPLDYDNYDKRYEQSEILTIAAFVAAFALTFYGLFLWIKFVRRYEAERKTAPLGAMIKAVRNRSVGNADEQAARELLYELAKIEYDQLSTVNRWLTIEPDKAAYMNLGPLDETEGHAEQ